MPGEELDKAIDWIQDGVQATAGGKPTKNTRNKQLARKVTHQACLIFRCHPTAS